MRRKRIAAITVEIYDQGDMRYYTADADRDMSLAELYDHLCDTISMIEIHLAEERKPHLVRVK
jgi:hypothetical protein